MEKLGIISDWVEESGSVLAVKIFALPSELYWREWKREGKGEEEE